MFLFLFPSFLSVFFCFLSFAIALLAEYYLTFNFYLGISLSHSFEFLHLYFSWTLSFSLLPKLLFLHLSFSIFLSSLDSLSHLIFTYFICLSLTFNFFPVKVSFIWVFVPLLVWAKFNVVTPSLKFSFQQTNHYLKKKNNEWIKTIIKTMNESKQANIILREWNPFIWKTHSIWKLGFYYCNM